ncbi:MAG: DUF2029 domain-containing protein [Promethearchaeota archaeon]|nr:MAG: DUF2029 domain-containing protein [Candidatus Lokiarchaeota archaeon]
MSLEKRLLEFRKKFISLWDFNLFKIAIFIQIGYITITIIFFFTIFYKQNDFIVFYNSGRRILFDINDLYLRESEHFFFRYFPLSAIFYIPFSLFNFNFGYITFLFFNLLLNIGICLNIYKIINLIRPEEKKSEEKIARYVALFLGAAPQVNNYILGQNNLLVAFFILWAIYIFIKKNSLKWDFFASILIGVSITIKPIIFLAIPFLLVVNYRLKEKKFKVNLKTSIIRLVGIGLFLLPNIVLFYCLPHLWEGFISNNFGGAHITEIRHSFSITKLILNFLVYYSIPFNQIAIILTLLLVFGTFGYLIFLISNIQKKSVIYGMTIGIIIMLLIYFDSWDHHLLIVIPLLILIIFDLPEDSNISNLYLKPGLIFFVFLDLIFMGVWFMIKNWFPYNFLATLFLVLSFYGICKYLLKNKFFINESKNNY